MKEKVRQMRIGDRVDSELHQPVEVRLGEKESRDGRGEKGGRKIWRGICDRERWEMFRKKLGEIG